jgi:hypothetical protein
MFLSLTLRSIGLPLTEVSFAWPAVNLSKDYRTIANTSTAPITAQQIALRCSPANQNPLAALKQRKALVHPLINAPGLLSILRSFIGLSR